MSYSFDDLRAWATTAPRHKDTLAAAEAVLRLLDELARIEPVFKLACELQDSDQCEDHSTGDECAQGEVEHRLFQALVKARAGEPDAEDRFSPDRTDPLQRGEKARGRVTPSKSEHVTNDHDDCVSWCPACRENTSQGLNPDGSAPDKPRLVIRHNDASVASANRFIIPDGQDLVLPQPSTTFDMEPGPNGWIVTPTDKK